MTRDRKKGKVNPKKAKKKSAKKKLPKTRKPALSGQGEGPAEAKPANLPTPRRGARAGIKHSRPEEPPTVVPDPEENLERSFPAVINALLERGKDGNHVAAKAAVELIEKLEKRQEETGEEDEELMKVLLQTLGIDPTELVARLAAKRTKERV